MRALALLVVLVPSLAFAGVELRRVERAGTGPLPHDADELVYRIDFTWRGEATETTETSARKSAIAMNDSFRDDLRAMREGEVRRLSGHEIDGNTCDHFDCGDPKVFTARIELHEGDRASRCVAGRHADRRAPASRHRRDGVGRARRRLRVVDSRGACRRHERRDRCDVPTGDPRRRDPHDAARRVARSARRRTRGARPSSR